MFTRVKRAVIFVMVGKEAPMGSSLKQSVSGSSSHDGHDRDIVRGEVRKVDVLCDKDREMMLEFSRLCVKRLNNHLPIKLFLSLFQQFFDANVLKEIEKNRSIILHAASGFERGKDRAEMDVNELFELTKKVDTEFVRKTSNPLFSLEVRYDDFAEIRKKRIASLATMVFDLFCNWHTVAHFHHVVKSTYTEERYKEMLSEVLHLYNVETKMLSKSITFHGPAGRVKDLFAEKLFTTMEKTAGDIAVVYTRKVYAASSFKS